MLNLGTREPNDPTVALLDAWAVVADVLTFYRERLTNEGYLRTANEERALRELAALVGFKPRPGVAATAYLAYLLDKTATPVEIPVGAKAQSVPAPGEQMQTFETGEAFVAHAEWSQMAPRLTRPAQITLVDALLRPTLRLADTSLFVRTGERVLFVFDSAPGFQVMREVAAAKMDIQAGYVELQLKARFGLTPGWAEALGKLRNLILGAAEGNARDDLLEALSSYFLGGSATDGQVHAEEILAKEETPPRLKDFAQELGGIFKDITHTLAHVALNRARASSVSDVVQSSRRQPSSQLASNRLLSRTAGKGLAGTGEDRLSLLKAMTPELASTLPSVLNNLPISAVSAPTVHLLRATAGAFGALAPPLFTEGGRVNDKEDRELEPIEAHFSFLDAVYDGVQPDSFVAFDRLYRGIRHGDQEAATFHSLRIARVRSVQTVARGAYGIPTGKSTRLELVSLDGQGPVSIFTKTEFSANEFQSADLRVLRNTLYYVHSEVVRLADDAEDGDVLNEQIELQARVDGLQSGQWLIVAGDRTDIRDANKAPVPGVRGGELAMIASVEQKADPDASGDTLHTVITLVKLLAYSYKRSSTTIYGNVVKASHGETVSEVLGSGDARRGGQRFMCSRSPLTFTSAPTVAGVEGSEVVRVNGVRYRSVASLLDADAGTRGYQRDTDEAGAATLTCGDGVHGARLPSGPQNVRVSYRVGIGSPGNVRAEQISLLTTRPLGVTGVINPLRASGGADRDGPERIRRHAPLAVRALSPLSRLVSVEDYADFAHLFAGIGQADAIRLSDGAQEVVHVTVAGVDDNPLDPEGELLANLRAAYARYGDPAYPVEIAVRELKALVIEVKVAIDPDADWNLVEPELRRRLLDEFSFERRRLGQPAYLSEAIAVIQGTPGVAWADVDMFGGVTESEVRDATALDDATAKPAPSSQVSAARTQRNPEWMPGSPAPRFLPAQLAFLLPDVRDLLVLNPK